MADPGASVSPPPTDGVRVRFAAASVVVVLGLLWAAVALAPSPAAAQLLPPAVSVGGGYDHTCLLEANGTVSCWGINSGGELGDNATERSLTRRAVWGISDAAALAVGATHACALVQSSGGRYIRCWGRNDRGQLGDGGAAAPTTTSAPPVDDDDEPAGPRPRWVAATLELQQTVSLGAGYFHTCATLENGGLHCWGANSYGAIGDGSTEDRATPVAVNGLNDAVAVDGGLFHTCALQRTGGVSCWGNNQNGQLGDGTTVDRATPSPVPGITTATAIATGAMHSCALLADRSVRCWGQNAGGQLGDATTTDRSAAVAVQGLGEVRAIAANGSHTCAVGYDGTVACWGSNAFGELGDGTRNPATTPRPVAGVTGAETVGLGPRHSCVILADRAVRCWGDNPEGQLGDGTTTWRSLPTAVLGEPPHHFRPLAPVRLLDTRTNGPTIDGLGSGGGARGDGTVTEVRVAGRAGIPADAAAVVLNVTATEPSAPGFVTVFPCGAPRPWASNLNFGAGTTVPNAVTVKVGAGGAVCVYNEGGSVHLVIDATGHHPAGGEFGAMSPARLYDSRPDAVTVDGVGAGDGVRKAGGVTMLHVTGRAGVPVDAEAVVLNVTATDASGPGFVTVWPCGAPFPLASSLNLDAGRMVANAVTTKIGTDGRVCLYVDRSDTHLVVDVSGYFGAGAGFESLVPARLADTRRTVPMRSGTFNWVMTRDTRGIAPNASAAVLNVTITDATGPGFLTVWPCSEPRPWASSLNFTAGRTVANQVTSKIGDLGWVCYFIEGADAQLIVDVNGYYPDPGR